MAKLKNNFLEKVYKEESIYTRTYYYTCKQIEYYNGKTFVRPYIISRLPIEYVGTTRMLDKIFWEKVATTMDGKNFIRVREG